MLRRKRILKRHRVTSRRKILRVFLLIIGVVLFVLPIGVFLLQHGKPLYMSPLPALAKKVVLSAANDPQKILVERQIASLKLPVSSVDNPQDEAITLHMIDNGDVILSLQKDLIQQISSLQVIMTRLTMEGKRFKRLDLRFDRPVITFQQ